MDNDGRNLETRVAEIFFTDRSWLLDFSTVDGADTKKHAAHLGVGHGG